MAYFNNSSQKHLGIHLDEKLNFIHHIKEKLSKTSEAIVFIKKLNNTLPRKPFTCLLPDPIWIMGTSDMISQTMKSFAIIMKLFNTMQHWLLPVTGSI